MRIENVFKDEDGEKGVGVIDLISGLVEILQLEAEELQDIAWQALEPVESWDEG